MKTILVFLIFLFIYIFWQDWVGLPAGVKFDPTDQELIEHLEAKVVAKESKSHPLIDEFIPTIEGEDGICYTHPEKLPGVDLYLSPLHTNSTRNSGIFLYHNSRS